MFPWPCCGSRLACLRHSHEFVSVVTLVILVTLSTYRVVHVQLQQKWCVDQRVLTHADYFIGHGIGV